MKSLGLGYFIIVIENKPLLGVSIFFYYFLLRNFLDLFSLNEIALHNTQLQTMCISYMLTRCLCYIYE